MPTIDAGRDYIAIAVEFERNHQVFVVISGLIQDVVIKDTSAKQAKANPQIQDRKKPRTKKS